MKVAPKQLLIVALAVCLTVASGHGPAAEAAMFVVDQRHPAASDENPGSEEAPFRTIQRAAEAARPGDTVCVMEGDYDERIAVKRSGRRGAPITFRGLPGGRVEMQGFEVGSAGFIRIEGFSICVDEGVGITIPGGNDIEILDNYFHDLYGAVSGGAIHRDPEQQWPANVRIAYNKVYRPQQGMTISGKNWTVESNEILRLTIHRRGDCDYSRAFGRGHVIRYNLFHDTRGAEIGKAHVDWIQTFDVNGEVAHDITVHHNVGHDFHQAFVGECDKPGNVSNWTFHHNIFWPTWGAWGLSTRGIPGVQSINNTYYGMKWFGVGIQGERARGGAIRNNIFQDIYQAIRTNGNSVATECNIIYKADPKNASAKDLVNVDPKMVNPAGGNFRLLTGSPAIDAGTDGDDIGALEYPNVYYVDPRHPGGSDEHFGYAGRPFQTIAKACAVARAEETIILRGGVYRETIIPRSDGITIRAMKGEKAVVSGADLITNWKREGAGWAAPSAAEPKSVLLDGNKWTSYTYDVGAGKIRCSGFDPRLRVIEHVVREHGLDLQERSIQVEGVAVENTSAEGVVNAGSARLIGVTVDGKPFAKAP